MLIFSSHNINSNMRRHVALHIENGKKKHVANTVPL